MLVVVCFGLGLQCNKCFFKEQAQWLNGDRMWWTSNDTIQKRNVDKTLGMIKHKLHENQKIELKDILIKWDERMLTQVPP